MKQLSKTHILPQGGVNPGHHLCILLTRLYDLFVAAIAHELHQTRAESLHE